ncbi:MAG: hypothetical protein K8S16_16105, partial [Bacteroidales bacterium]|nr:hypothetical protein [Bacteroidales bacterium]
WASWNDTYLMWEMLVYEKGYDNDNVFVLFADGQDWSITNKNIAGRYDAQEMFPLDFPRAFDQITDYPATLENLERLIINLRNGNNSVPEITENDFLLIWAFRPVYDNGKKEIIYFNNNITREVSELNALLKKIPAKKQFTFLSPKRVI